MSSDDLEGGPPDFSSSGSSDPAPDGSSGTAPNGSSGSAPDGSSGSAPDGSSGTLDTSATGQSEALEQASPSQVNSASAVLLSFFTGVLPDQMISTQRESVAGTSDGGLASYTGDPAATNPFEPPGPRDTSQWVASNNEQQWVLGADLPPQLVPQQPQSNTMQQQQWVSGVGLPSQLSPAQPLPQPQYPPSPFDDSTASPESTGPKLGQSSPGSVWMGQFPPPTTRPSTSPGTPPPGPVVADIDPDLPIAAMPSQQLLNSEFDRKFFNFTLNPDVLPAETPDVIVGFYEVGYQIRQSFEAISDWLAPRPQYSLGPNNQLQVQSIRRDHSDAILAIGQLASYVIPELSVSSDVPVATIRFTDTMAEFPTDANFLRFNVEWAQTEGDLIRGARPAIDARLRALARAELRSAEVDISYSQAMHPLNSIAAGQFITPETELGTTFYFGAQPVNSSFGAQLNNELYRLGVTDPGMAFRVEFVGFPSYEVAPPIAPPASSPNLFKKP